MAFQSNTRTRAFTCDNFISIHPRYAPPRTTSNVQTELNNYLQNVNTPSSSTGYNIIITPQFNQQDTYGSVINNPQMVQFLNNIPLLTTNDIFEKNGKINYHKAELCLRQNINQIQQSQMANMDQLIHFNNEFSIAPKEIALIHNMKILQQADAIFAIKQDLLMKIMRPISKYASQGLFLLKLKEQLPRQWKAFCNSSILNIFNIRSYDTAKSRINCYTYYNEFFDFYFTHSNRDNIFQDSPIKIFKHWYSNIRQKPPDPDHVMQQPLESWQFTDNQSNHSQNIRKGRSKRINLMQSTNSKKSINIPQQINDIPLTVMPDIHASYISYTPDITMTSSTSDINTNSSHIHMNDFPVLPPINTPSIISVPTPTPTPFCTDAFFTDAFEFSTEQKDIITKSLQKLPSPNLLDGTISVESRLQQSQKERDFYYNKFIELQRKHVQLQNTVNNINNNQFKVLQLKHDKLQNVIKNIKANLKQYAKQGSNSKQINELLEQLNTI